MPAEETSEPVVTETFAPAAPQPEAAAEAPAAVPTVFDRAKALMKSKPTLQAELRTLTEANTKLAADLATANAIIQTQAGELTRLRQLETDLTATVEELETGKQTVAAAAADLVAQTGIAPEKMPEQEGQGSDFASRHSAAVKAGPKALGQFFRENKAEVREQLTGSRG